MTMSGDVGRAVGRRKRLAALGTVVSMAVTAGLLAIASTTASADTAPTSPTVPETVSADVLPTVQINGVVWDQVIVGNRVYATGQFSQARPAGAAPGTNETPRSNILAYDLTTGQLITTWAPTLNQQGLVITASPDGTTIYVGGDFTNVSGLNRQRVVALDATTGAVRPAFAPVANTRVQALAVADGNLYIGGYFTTMSGQSRSRLAAVDATTGALLPWAPTVEREVVSMVAVNGRVVAGGSFVTANGIEQRGTASFDGVTGNVMPWALNTIVRNTGPETQISDLHTDGELVYGVAWGYYVSGVTPIPGADFEGTFAAHWDTGALEWINACRGDQYSIADSGNVLYTSGHIHECGMVGGWRPETNPRTWQWAMAMDKRGTPGLTNAVGSYADWQHFAGRPASQFLHWTPLFSPGTYTDSDQAGWSVAANDQYVVYGGEFPRVNGVNQQGLVRFAVKSIAPNTDATQGFPELTPVLTPVGPGSVRVEFQAAHDRDNARLTYEILRGPTTATSTVVGSFTYDSNWWTRPPLGFVDTTAPPGSSQTYRIRVRDAFGTGFAASLPSTITIPAGTPDASAYRASVMANGAFEHWRLGESSGTTAYDTANAVDLTLSSSADRNVSGALLNEPTDRATSWPGTSSTSTVQGVSQSWTINAQDPEPQYGPQTFSLELWFRTNTLLGGKLLGFGDSRTGRSADNRNDRNLYLTTNGQIRFGLRPDAGTRRTIDSPSGLNNNQWHHVVATLSPTTGASLFIDGQRVAQDLTLTEAQEFFGYWRVAGDRLSSWPSAPLREAFAGSIDEVAIYPTALTPLQVQQNYEASGRTGVFPNIPPIALFDSTTADLTATFDASASNDPDGTTLSYAWSFGDGQTGSGVAPQHTYAAAGTYDVTLTVIDADNATDAEVHSVTVTAPPPNVPPNAVFTSTVDHLTASFDASGSDDPDGTTLSYLWDFGDGLSGSGVSPQHTYANPGTYDVTLTVTDADDAEDIASGSVTATPLPVEMAADAFERTAANGLGTADIGGPWTLQGPAASFSVSGGAGRLIGATGATRAGYLTQVSARDQDIVADVSLDRAITGNGAYVSVTGRRVSDGNDYRLKLQYRANGTVGAFLERYSGGVQTQLAFVANVPGLTMAPDDVLSVRFQVVGTSPTLVRAKVWRAGTAEPAGWLVTANDAPPTLLQEAGHLGVHFFTSGSWTGAGAVLRVDNLKALPPE